MATLTDIENSAGRGMGEPWIEWHQRMFDAMMAHHAKTGKFVDPAIGVEFPPGRQMVKHPNRTQIRELGRWRTKHRRWHTAPSTS